jgi:hypothetical protein
MQQQKQRVEPRNSSSALSATAAAAQHQVSAVDQKLQQLQRLRQQQRSRPTSAALTISGGSSTQNQAPVGQQEQQQPQGASASTARSGRALSSGRSMRDATVRTAQSSVSVGGVASAPGSIINKLAPSKAAGGNGSCGGQRQVGSARALNDAELDAVLQLLGALKGRQLS